MKSIIKIKTFCNLFENNSNKVQEACLFFVRPYLYLKCLLLACLWAMY